jgi:hypothetical protein
MGAFVVLACLSFLLPVSDVSDRLNVSLLLVLTTVAYRYAVISMLPKIAYMTLIDKCTQRRFQTHSCRRMARLLLLYLTRAHHKSLV